MKNAHCPSPTKEQPSRPAAVSPPSPAAKAATAGSLKALRKAVSSRPAEERSASARRSTEGGTEQKCRELRDLHNSMERQRRVDLKINFDQLKDKVRLLLRYMTSSRLVLALVILSFSCSCNQETGFASAWILCALDHEFK